MIINVRNSNGIAKCSDNNTIIYQASKQYTEFHCPRHRKRGSNTSFYAFFRSLWLMCVLNLVECLVSFSNIPSKIGLKIFLHRYASFDDSVYILLHIMFYNMFKVNCIFAHCCEIIFK